MTYGEKLTQLRKNAHLTQAELGDKLGVTAQAVSKWEHDVSQPDLGTLVRIAELFGISTDDFLSATKTETPLVAVDPQKVAQEIAPLVSEQVAATVREEVTEGNKDVKEALQDKQEQPLGHCVECGVTIYKSNLGTKSPKCMCKNCLQRSIREQERLAAEDKAKKETERNTLRSKRNRSMFWGIVLAVVVLGAAIAWAILSKGDVGIKCAIAFGGLYVAYAAWAMVGELVNGDSAAASVLEWCVTRSINWPGVIFSLDFGGIVFLITVKILFAVLGFLAGLVMLALGVALALLISGFTYPFTLHKINKKIAGNMPIEKDDLI